MSPKISLLLTALLLAGCATTPGTSYYYDGDGDYYYGDASADVIVDSYGPSYGAGYGGWGYGHGYGAGFGYYGYGGYGGFYPSWYYGYPAYAWWLWPPHHDNGADRMGRLQQDRAWRSSIAARPTIQAHMAKWDRDGAFARPAPLLRRQVDSSPRRFEGSLPTQNGPRVRPAPAPTMRSSAPAPHRSQPSMQPTPAPMRPASRKQ